MKKLLFLLPLLFLTSLSFGQVPPQKRTFNVLNLINGKKDLTAPTIAVTSNAVQPLTAGTFTATFTFSEVVTGFVVGDISITGASLSAFGTSNNIVFTATITPTFAADITIQVLAGVCIDASGNANTASNLLSIDATVPTVVASSNAVQPLTAGTFTATFIFSEAVTGFTSSDLAIAGASSSSLSTSNNITFTSIITPTFAADITIQVPASVCVDATGHNNNASNTLSIDATNPTVVTSSNAVQPVSTGTFTATFIFSEAVTGFASSDLSITGASSGALSTSDNITFTSTITPTFTSDVTIQVPAAVCIDATSHNNLASNTLTVVATYQIGTLHTDNFNSNGLASYSQTGSTMSASTGDLLINTSAGTFANYLVLNTPSIVAGMATHCLEKWVIQVLFTCPTGTPFGFGVGPRSTNGPEQFDNIVRLAFDAAQEAKQGTVYYYSAQNHSASPTQTVATMGATFTLVTGTDYIFEVERAKNVFTARLKSANGVTTHKTYTSLTYNQTSTNTVRAHNTGKFGLWAFGGTNLVVKSFTITSGALKNPALLALMDSNGSLYAGANSARAFELAAVSLNKSFEIMWGINAEIPDIPVTAALTLAHPTYTKIYVNVGSNDKANGVSDATRRTRYATMISAFNTGGFSTGNLVLGIPAARNGIDIALLKTDMDGTYSAYTRVDIYTTTKQPGNTSLQVAYNIGDNIHLTTAGHAACATPIAAAMPDGSEGNGLGMLFNVIDEEGQLVPVEGDLVEVEEVPE